MPAEKSAHSHTSELLESRKVEGEISGHEVVAFKNCDVLQNNKSEAVRCILCKVAYKWQYHTNQ
jgi:hypothetical protein